MPVYCCSVFIEELYRRVKLVLEGINVSFELIFVNDGSPENVWEIIKAIRLKDNRVKGINLSRNFGQHHAISAGLDFTLGKWVVVMDGDLQDRPEEIKNLYKKINEGFDVVFAIREKRQDDFLKVMTSKIFFYVFDYLAGVKTDSRTNTFSICSRNVIGSFKQLKEQTRSYSLFIRWLGFKTGYINVEHSYRKIGKSSYSLKMLISLATDYVMIYSNKPLKLSIVLGFLFSFISFFFGCYLVFNYFVRGVSIQGWTSLMTLILFVSGLLFFCMGIIGLYVGKIFDETKARPIYVIREYLGLKQC